MRSESRRALAAVAIAWTGVAGGGCASHVATPRDDLTPPAWIAVPPCDAAKPVVTLELLKVSPDLTGRKPSTLKHVLVDLRIQTRDTRALWLLVNEEAFPPTVTNVSRTPEGGWAFSGDDYVEARWLGPAPDTSIKDLAVSTGDRKIPVSLATIYVEGLPPQRWVAGGGRKARTDIDVVCTTWLTLAPDVAPSSP